MAHPIGMVKGFEGDWREDAARRQLDARIDRRVPTRVCLPGQLLLLTRGLQRTARGGVFSSLVLVLVFRQASIHFCAG